MQQPNKLPDGVQVTTEEIWALLKEVNDRVSTLEHRYGYVSSAFVKNDLGKPDYDGHRKEHIDIQKQADAIDGYKQEGAKGLIKGAVGFIVGIFSLGLIEWIRTEMHK